MTVKQKKRRWSDEEKRSICFQASARGVSVAQVARRYAMNANLVFKWLRDERYAPEPDATAEEAEPIFLPVEVEAWNNPVPALTPVYIPAVVAARHNPDMKRFYERLIKAGKPAKVAFTAIMRKLILLANSLIKQNREWMQIRT